jgi:hypothetical protein
MEINWNYHRCRTIFIAQYKAVYRNSENLNTITNIHIQPEAMQPIEFDKMVFSNLELRKFAMDIIQKKSEKIQSGKKKSKTQFSSIMYMS